MPKASVDVLGSGDEIGRTGGNERESKREAAEIHMRREMRMNLGHGSEKRSGVNWTQGKGRKLTETLGQQGRGDPWRSLYRDVKGNAERHNQKRIRKKRERSHRSRKMTKEP